jgi:hypothetical protein
MKILWQGREVEAERVDFTVIEEPFARATLKDGDELVIRTVFLDVFKLIELGTDGKPQFVAISRSIVALREAEPAARVQ